MTTYDHRDPKRVFTLFETVRFGRSRIPPWLVRGYCRASNLSSGPETRRKPSLAVTRRAYS